MSEEVKTPREWWITDNGGPMFELLASTRPLGANSVSVIERTAYDDLLASAKELVVALGCIASRTFVDDLEGPELRAQNACNFRDAKNALANFKRKHGGA